MFKRASKNAQIAAGAGPSLRALIRDTPGKKQRPTIVGYQHASHANATSTQPKQSPILSRRDLTPGLIKQGENASKRARKARRKLEDQLPVVQPLEAERTVVLPLLDERKLVELRKHRALKVRRLYERLVQLADPSKPSFLNLSARERQQQMKELRSWLGQYLCRE